MLINELLYLQWCGLNKIESIKSSSLSSCDWIEFLSSSKVSRFSRSWWSWPTLEVFAFVSNSIEFCCFLTLNLLVYVLHSMLILASTLCNLSAELLSMTCLVNFCNRFLGIMGDDVRDVRSRGGVRTTWARFSCSSWSIWCWRTFTSLSTALSSSVFKNSHCPYYSFSLSCTKASRLGTSLVSIRRRLRILVTCKFLYSYI